MVKNVAGYDLSKLVIGSLGHPGRDNRGFVEASALALRQPYSWCSDSASLARLWKPPK